MLRALFANPEVAPVHSCLSLVRPGAAAAAGAGPPGGRAGAHRGLNLIALVLIFNLTFSKGRTTNRASRCHVTSLGSSAMADDDKYDVSSREEGRRE